MNVPYTKEELNRTLDFINERLSLQRKSTSLLTNAMYKAALLILILSRKYKIEPKMFRFSLNKSLKKQVDKIIDDLAKQIIENTETLAEYGIEEDSEEHDTIVSVLDKKTNGETIEDKVYTYTQRFKNEMEVVAASSMSLNKSPQNTANEIKKILPIILSSYLVKQARKENFSSIDDLIINYGIGMYASSFNNLNRLVTNTIAVSRQELFYLRETKNGANAWYVQRGSSYPCSLCDSNVGIHYNSFDLPPYHPNCVCMAIPINTKTNE